MADEWHYHRQGRQAGPVTLEQLRQMIRNGQLSPHDPVWNESMTDWKPAGQVPEVADAFGAGPASAPAAQVLEYQGPSYANVAMTPYAMEMLRQTRPWAKFMSIVLFVSAGLMVVVGTAMAFVEMGGPAGVALSLLYVAIAALYIIPGVFLNRYASRIGDLLSMRREQDLEQALQAQKSFWRFVGILVLIILIFYAVLLLIIALVALLA